MKRREFFKNFPDSLLSVLGVALAGYVILQFLFYARETTKSVIFRPAKTLLDINYKLGIYLIREGSNFKALSARCTHLGCTVAFNQRKREFHCPCHGSIYDRNGKKLSGPAKKPLSSLSVRKEKNGDMVVMLKE
ncbi:ubiquinol-cytochrome c reductase iron-sulfur subunit [Nitrospinota bacterium]